MSGTVCVASQDQARFHTFTQLSIYVDTSVWVGHMGTCVVRPIYKNGQWKIGVGVPGGTDGTAVDIEIEPSVRTTQ